MSSGYSASARLVNERRREVITGCLGSVVEDLMLDPQVTDIVLNADSVLWVSRLGRDSEPISSCPCAMVIPPTQNVRFRCRF